MLSVDTVSTDEGDAYGELYYRTQCGPIPYERSEPWLSSFAAKAAEIIRSLAPATVLDAGCAFGFLVEALWDRGVEARGIDISPYAISRVRPDMEGFCAVASLTDPIEGRYDLVTCIEVLEHLQPPDALIAVKHMAAASDAILFSSTPDDFSERTHVNVRPILYWLQQFAAVQFRPDVSYDASYIAPHAILFRRTDQPPCDALLGLFSEHIRLRLLWTRQTVQLRSQNTVVARTTDEVGRMQMELDALRRSLARSDRGRILTLTRHFLARNDATAARTEATQSRLAADALKQALAGARRELEEQLRKAAQTSNDNLKLMEELAQLRSIVELDRVRISALEEINANLASRGTAAEEQLRVLEASTFWRATAPLRRAADRLPVPVRSRLRRTARAAYRLTRSLRRQSSGPGPAPASLDAGWTTQPKTTIARGQVRDVGMILSSRFSQLRPLRVFPAAGAAPRVTVVTDSINAGSLYGGVGTSLILGTLLANRLGAALRIATRAEAAQSENFGHVLRAHAIAMPSHVEFISASPADSDALDLHGGDLFLTTSWWTTATTLQSVSAKQIVYLIQEDERMFYPHGDDHLRAAEVLSDERLRFVINSELLCDHFRNTGLGIIADRGVWFEPAFPHASYYWESTRQPRPQFLFYARPGNLRNLYYRGLEAIDLAVNRKILDTQRWDFTFVGRDLEAVALSDGTLPRLLSNLNWADYCELVRTCDVGLTLMYTPHPSYPPLDIAASGGIAVTNTFANKHSLDRYSDNIICTEPTVEALVIAIARAVALAGDVDLRRRHYESSRFNRSWQETLDPVVATLAREV